jgi:hypothetical protein
MSYAVAALQDQAQTAADAFCSRYAQTPARKGGIVRHSKPGVLKQCPRPKIGKFYVPAHIPFPCLHRQSSAEACGRLSRPQSTMNVSDSLYAFGLPRLFLFGLPASLPERIGSRPVLSEVEAFLTILSLQCPTGRWKCRRHPDGD